jgi:hypothetical protein
VNPGEVVIEEVNRNHRRVILEFLGKAILRRVKRRIPIRIVRL